MSNELMVTNSASSNFFSTLPAETKRDKMVIAKALNAATSLKDEGDKPFVIVGIMTTHGVRTQSGTDCTNTYLIKQDGNAVFSQSDGIARSAEWIHTIFTNDEIAEGLTVFVKSIPLDNGRSLKTLDFVLE